MKIQLTLGADLVLEYVDLIGIVVVADSPGRHRGRGSAICGFLK